MCVLFYSLPYSEGRFSRDVANIRPPDKRANLKLIFFFLKECILDEQSKEPRQSDGSFEYPKHMFKVLGKKHYNFTL